VKKQFLLISMLMAASANASTSLNAPAQMDNGFPLQVTPVLNHGVAHFGTQFSSVNELCFKASFESIDTEWVSVSFIDKEGNHISGLSVYPKSGEYKCTSYFGSYAYLQMIKSGMLEFNVKAAVPVKDLEFKIVGEPEISGEIVTISAEENTINSVNGTYLTHTVEPNTVYSVAIIQNQAVHNSNGDKFGSVGLSYEGIDGVKRLVAIEDKPVFISTKGEMNFFLADNDQDNTGKVLLNVKRVNID
jgi:hypothetical protein